MTREQLEAAGQELRRAAENIQLGAGHDPRLRVPEITAVVLLLGALSEALKVAAISTPDNVGASTFRRTA